MAENALVSERQPMNAALFASFRDEDFLKSSLLSLGQNGQKILISDNETFLTGAGFVNRFSLNSVLLDAGAPDPEVVMGAFEKLVREWRDFLVFVVDMSWGAEAVHSGRAFEVWGAVTEQLVAGGRASVVSLYSRELLVEYQMQSALRAHRYFLAPSGAYENPFWLPPNLLGGTVDEQMAFLLGRAVPDYFGHEFFDADGRLFARGSGPGWLTPPRRIDVARGAAPRWHIRCFGQLKVYCDGACIDWNLPGGSPNKIRTIFAYLLIAGEKGAHADRLGELLWPGQEPEKVKRGRLHHNVAMLRKALQNRYAVLRSGEYYRLNVPEDSWTDVSAFEQTCRRGLALAKQGQEEEALRIYRTGDRLYEGDLFEDIPVEYTGSDLEDWCLPRRRWLREMAIKLLNDSSICLRSLGRTGQALEKCQRALLLEPASEEANCEAMRVFHAQGRIDAITRQYRQFLKVAEGATEGAEIHRLYRNLMM